MLLVGITTTDEAADVSRMSSKLLSLRVFEDIDQPAGTSTEWVGKPWSKNVSQVDGEILCVSQFTLYGTIKKGTKPDFHRAAKGEHAQSLYETFLRQLRDGLGQEKVKDGQFGAMMDVALINDGPVTLVYDTKDPNM